MNEVNLLREIYLTINGEKAKNGKSSHKTNKALFAALLSMRDGDDVSSSRERVLPRIKAARLEEFEVHCKEIFLFASNVHREITDLACFFQHSNKEEDENGHPHIFDMSLIAISRITVVLVGFLSFLKSK